MKTSISQLLDAVGGLWPNYEKFPISNLIMAEKRLHNKDMNNKDARQSPH